IDLIEGYHVSLAGYAFEESSQTLRLDGEVSLQRRLWETIASLIRFLPDSRLGSPIFGGIYQKRSFSASRSASIIASKKSLVGFRCLRRMSPAASGWTRRPARAYTASLPYWSTSLAVSSALETRSFSLSDSLAPFFTITFLMSSSAIPRAATNFDPHSGHFTIGGISLILRISTYFQQFVHTRVLTSFRILALADPTRIWFSFSVGMMSAFLLILSNPILAMGVASPLALTVLTAISFAAIAFKTSWVWGTSMSFS